MSPPELLARSRAFASLAALLGPDPEPLSGGAELAALRDVLAALGEDDALAALAPIDSMGTLDPDELAGNWVRWFDHGRLPPYECSNVPQGASGHTGQLADIAGFYRAFGMRVVGDRPDHVVAELEFLAWALATEARARVDGLDDPAAVCAQATAWFLRDHIGVWLAGWSARVGATEGTGALGPVAVAAACLVAAEAARRGVEPRSPVAGWAPAPGGAGDCTDESDVACLECGGPGAPACR